MENKTTKSILESGTGFMINPTETIKTLQGEGYTSDLIPCFDHFECRQSETKLYPDDFDVIERIRFENTSDPDDQSILFVIESNHLGIKGLFLESYGVYHEDLSHEMSHRLRVHH